MALEVEHALARQSAPDFRRGMYHENRASDSAGRRSERGHDSDDNATTKTMDFSEHIITVCGSNVVYTVRSPLRPLLLTPLHDLLPR